MGLAVVHSGAGHGTWEAAARPAGMPSSALALPADRPELPDAARVAAARPVLGRLLADYLFGGAACRLPRCALVIGGGRSVTGRSISAPGAGAGVVPLIPLEVRTEARRLAADCAGWRIWYWRQSRVWIAHRCGGIWGSGDTRRLFAVAAADPEALRLRINCPALFHLDGEFSQWGAPCAGNDQWWAVWAGGDGQFRPLMCRPSPVRLVAALHEYVASAGERDDPATVWWG